MVTTMAFYFVLHVQRNALGMPSFTSTEDEQGWLLEFASRTEAETYAKGLKKKHPGAEFRVARTRA